MRRLFVLLVLVGFCVFLRAGPALASAGALSWRYGITEAENSLVDWSATTAVVDTSLHEIYLPKSRAGAASFWPNGGLDYIVMAPGRVIHFSFDGAKMVENPVASVTLPSNPLAVAVGWQYPDVVVALPDKLYHYSFTGTGMVENPALSVAGLIGVVSVGVREGEVAGLGASGVRDYMFDGVGMVEVPQLVPPGLTNPLALALVPGSYDVVVLDGKTVRYYNFNGSRLVENPALAITGLDNPVALAVAGAGEIAVVDGTEVKHYSFDGSGFRYNSALSVTGGLKAPVAVAVRPGSFDRIIVDGDEVRYYSWDGERLVYNPHMSVVVKGLSELGGYVPSAVVSSVTLDPGVSAGRVRVRAYVEVPERTSITFYVTADARTWVPAWRVRGTSSGPVAEVATGNTWTAIGDIMTVSPVSTLPELIITVPPGRSVAWKALLETSDPYATPKIVARPGTPGNGLVAVVWDTGGPLPPKVIVSGTCYTTSTPSIEWQLAGDNPSQSAYRLEVVRASDGALVYDSDVVQGTVTAHVIMPPGYPEAGNPLWSSGEYRFRVRVKIWDASGAESDWSEWAEFCVTAFDRPRVVSIVNPPPGQIVPSPNSPIFITAGMTVERLPKAKAGSKVTMLVDSIGPINTVFAAFPYGTDSMATVGRGPIAVQVNGTNKVWEVEFWTEASQAEVPEGTVVMMWLRGQGSEGDVTLEAPPYADGVAVIRNTIYADWFVVLRGRDKNK